MMHSIYYQNVWLFDTLTMVLLGSKREIRSQINDLNCCCGYATNLYVMVKYITLHFHKSYKTLGMWFIYFIYPTFSPYSIIYWKQKKSEMLKFIEYKTLINIFTIREVRRLI
jgi:hypothetical protein